MCVCVSQTCYTAYLLYIIQIEIWLIVDNVVCLDCFFEASFFSCSFLFLLCCLYFLFFRMFLCALCAATRHIHVSFLSWKLGCGKTMPLTLSSNMRFFSFTWYAYWDYIAKLCTNHSSVWRFSSKFLPPSHRIYNVFPRFNRNEQTGREAKKTIIVIILVFLHIFFYFVPVEHIQHKSAFQCVHDDYNRFQDDVRNNINSTKRLIELSAKPTSRNDKLEKKKNSAFSLPISLCRARSLHCRV